MVPTVLSRGSELPPPATEVAAAAAATATNPQPPTEAALGLIQTEAVTASAMSSSARPTEAPAMVVEDREADQGGLDIEEPLQLPAAPAAPGSEEAGKPQVSSIVHEMALALKITHCTVQYSVGILLSRRQLIA